MINIANITLQELQTICKNITNTYGEKILEEFLKMFWGEVSHQN